MSITKRVSKLTGKTTYLVRVFISENYATGKQKMITKTFKTLNEAHGSKLERKLARRLARQEAA